MFSEKQLSFKMCLGGSDYALSVFFYGIYKAYFKCIVLLSG